MVWVGVYRRAGVEVGDFEADFGARKLNDDRLPMQHMVNNSMCALTRTLEYAPCAWARAVLTCAPSMTSPPRLSHIDLCGNASRQLGEACIFMLNAIPPTK